MRSAKSEMNEPRPHDAPLPETPPAPPPPAVGARDVERTEDVLSAAVSDSSAPAELPFDEKEWAPPEPEFRGVVLPRKPLWWWWTIGWWRALLPTLLADGAAALWDWLRGADAPPPPPKYSPREIAARWRADYLANPAAWARALFFLLILGLFWVNAIHYWQETIDDAYITFRYSENLVRGLGPVYNPGERVEGFTNFTWMTAIAGCLAMGLDAMFCAKVLGFLSCVAAMWGVAVFGAALSRRRDIWNWAVLLPLALNAHFACWAMMGLETQLAVALLVWAYARFYQEMRDRRAWMISPLFASLAAMTRFESLYYMTPLAAWAAVQIARGRLDWRRFFRWGLACAVIFGAYYTWKVLYFGDLLPNTYYAKVHGDYKMRGVFHLREWYFKHGAAFLNLCLIPFLLCLLWPRPATLLALGPIVLNFFYVYYVNGDWMQNFRFLQVILPFMALALLLALRWLQAVLPLWGRAPADKRPEADGMPAFRRAAWIALEAAIWLAWTWLIFFKGREILSGSKTGPLGPLWLASIAATGLLLFMRWLALWTGAYPCAEEPEPPAPQAAGRDPRPFARPRRWRLRVFLAEALVFALFAALLVALATPLSGLATDGVNLARGVVSDLRTPGEVAASPPAKILFSRSGLIFFAIALLGAAWAARLVSRGALASAPARWPVYILFFLAAGFAGREQLRIGTLFVWGADPLRIERQPNSLRWSRVQKARAAGFSLALPQVAVWMLKNCKPGTTMFMSDIGYPMWLNMDVSVIDPDGLVTKEMANAPSVRGNLKSEKAHYAELLAQWRERYVLSPEEAKRVEARAAREAGIRDGETQPGAEVLQRHIAEFRARLNPPPDIEAGLRAQAYQRHRAEVNERNLRWLIEKRPEYCVMFLSHQSESGDSPPSFAYPEIADKYWRSPEFSKMYVEMEKTVKYGRSWNHFYRLRDFESEIPREEYLRRLREAIRRNPRCSHLYQELLQALRDSNTPYDDQMRAVIQSARRLFRCNTYFLNQFADTTWKLGDQKLAMDIWRQSLEADPAQEWLYRHLSDYYTRENQLDEAIRVGELGLKRAPNAWLCYHMAYLYDRAKNFEGAERVLRRAAEITKDRDPRAYEDLGALYDRNHRTAQAIEAFRKALEISPGKTHLQNVIRGLEEKAAAAPASTPAPKPSTSSSGS